MNKKIISSALVLAAGFCPILLNAQSGANTTTVSNTYRTTAATDTTYEFAENLYLEPNTNYQLDGTYIIFSKNVWISSSAQITGSGKIILADPSANTYYTSSTTSSTTLDHNNGSNISVPIEIQNPQGVVLGDITDPGFTATENTGAQLNIANSITFGVDNGNVYLNSNDLNLGDTAKLFDFSANRLVVTNNSINGHLVKNFGTTAAAFTFPIGIASSDYTPATITAQNGAYHASVTDYSNTGAVILAPSEGMDRTWHIYGDATSNALTLQHNLTTDGSDYVDNTAFITQYSGSGSWSTTTASEFVSSGVLTSNETAIASNSSDNGVWLSKASDRVSPLPIELKDFTINVKNCSPILIWSTGTESNFNHFEIERSIYGQNSFSVLSSVAATGSNSNYSFTDLTVKDNGAYLYRLKIVDNDQRYSYSNTLSTQLSCVTQTITLYPNPAHEAVYLSGLTDENIEVYNAVGQEILQQKASSGVNKLSLNELASGMYQINVVKNQQLIKTFKLIIK